MKRPILEQTSPQATKKHSFSSDTLTTAVPSPSISDLPRFSSPSMPKVNSPSMPKEKYSPKFDYFENASCSSGSPSPAPNYTLASSPPASRDDPLISNIQAAMDRVPTTAPPMLERFVNADEDPAETSYGDPLQHMQDPTDKSSKVRNDDGYETLSTTDDDEVPNAQNFMTFPKETRRAFYAQAFEGVFVDLKDLSIPNECAQWPDLAEEIFEAYLENVTLVIKVWTNYDSVMRRFNLNPAITETAGKIHLTPKQRIRIEALSEKHILEFRKVQFDIGTPFRTLYSGFLTVLPSNGLWTLKFRGRVHPDPHSPHDILRLVARRVFDAALRTSDWKGSQGLALVDLVCIARELHLKPYMYSDQYEDYRDWFTNR